MPERPDLDRQLSEYIDGIAEPVSDVEARRRAEPARVWSPRRRAIAAAFAGAAVVLIPAMVILALRNLPDDEITAPTSTAVTTTVPATTTTGRDVAPIATPEVVGLTVTEATARLTAAGLRVTVVGDGSADAVVTTQVPAAGAEVEVGAFVQIEAAGSPAQCGPDYEQVLPPAGEDEVDVTVLFGCAGGGEYPDVTVPVVRRVPAGTDVVAETLRALLAGPTPEEAAAGFGSFFSEASAGALNSVTVTRDGTAVVDFNDAIYVGNASTSTGSLFFMAELNANLFQFPDIVTIDYQVDGSCEAFWGWLQRECSLVFRGDWEYQVAQWDELREGGTIITPIPVEGLPEGLITVSFDAGVERIVWRSADPLADGDFADREIVRFRGSSTPPRIVASDRMGGILYETAGRIRWLPAGTDRPIDVAVFDRDDGRFTVVDDSVGDLGSPPDPVLLITDWEGAPVEAIALKSLEPREPAEVQAREAASYPLAVHLVESTERVPGVDEFYDDAYPTFLVVTNASGAEELRFRISTDHEPYVTLWDYDGRRVLLSREPYEPALAPQTFFLIDLSCGWDCTYVFFTGGTTAAALAGNPAPVSSTGDGWPSGPVPSCSAEGVPDVTPVEALPEAVAETRRVLAFNASLCQPMALDRWADGDRTEVVLSHAFLGDDPITTLESYRIRNGAESGPLAGLVSALESPYGSYVDSAGVEVFVWPGIASPNFDWGDPDAVTAARITYGDAIIDESLDFGGYPGLRIEIDRSGRWRFFGVELS